MKTKIFFFAAMLICSSLTACARSPFTKKTTVEFWKQPDSVIVSQLGESLTKILFSPKRVRCYHLLSKQNISDKEIMPVKGFVRDTLLSSFTDTQTAILQYLLLSNTNSYSEDIIAIEAPFRPVIEFEFMGKKNVSASVIISMSDRSWIIIYDGKEQLKYNYSDARFLERFCNYYLSEYYKNEKK